jgi:hypothetical protein
MLRNLFQVKCTFVRREGQNSSSLIHLRFHESDCGDQDHDANLDRVWSPPT